tara:strand:- start:965 stop:1087 length:123 start_codon:yes stop_codon:yes gene_type:complete
MESKKNIYKKKIEEEMKKNLIRRKKQINYLKKAEQERKSK